MSIANPYECVVGFEDGTVDVLTVHAYDAKDAVYQAIVAAVSKHGEGCGPTLRHIAPPASCWAANSSIRAAVTTLISKVKQAEAE